MSKRVIIIGGGPSGLACANSLAARNIDYVLLEQGAQASSAIRRVDPEMILLSPTRLSKLPGMDGLTGAGRYLSFAQLVRGLEDYQRRREIRLITRATVQSVKADRGGFAVGYQDGNGGEQILEGSHVVNATGIISRPRLPSDFDADSCSFTWKHSLDVRTADLLSPREILVIGGGPSATEVLERWLEVRKPEARASISLRGRLLAVPHRILGIDIHYFVWVPEHLPARFFGSLAQKFREPMTGLTVARAVRGGRIGRRPAVRAYRGDEVTFLDGSSVRPDLVVFATGFRYAAEHLGELVGRAADGTPMLRSCESTQTPNLFLLGVRFGRSPASAYLRGISRDAKYLAAKIGAQ
jgi:putative flavoprotein involved in K+ transport